MYRGIVSGSRSSTAGEAASVLLGIDVGLPRLSSKLQRNGGHA